MVLKMLFRIERICFDLDLFGIFCLNYFNIEPSDCVEVLHEFDGIF